MTSPASATPSLRVVALGDLEHELATTRRVLERVPGEHLDWKPHPKSFSLGQLAQHVANLAMWGSTTMTGDGLDFAGPLPQPPVSRTRDALLAAFDANAAELRAALARSDDAALQGMWTARRGEQVLFALPRVAVLRGQIVNHMVHHRGQLSVYLRLLDVPVPAMYGPTADEPG